MGALLQLEPSPVPACKSLQLIDTDDGKFLGGQQRLNIELNCIQIQFLTE